MELRSTPLTLKSREMFNKPGRDELIGGIALLVFMIATATGNAFAMLGMSIAALVLIATFARKKLGSASIVLASVVAVASFAVAMMM
jgi:hypothetical protein